MSCFWKHKWETKKIYSGKAYKGNMLGRVIDNISAECIFQECPKCHTVRCIVDDGEDSSEVDAGFYARKVIMSFPSAANDSYMKEIAAL